MDLRGATELVADLHQLDRELQRFLEGEARRRFCREQVGEVAPTEIGGSQYLDPSEQAGFLRRHVEVAIAPVEELIWRLELRQQDPLGCQFR